MNKIYIIAILLLTIVTHKCYAQITDIPQLTYLLNSDLSKSTDILLKKGFELANITNGVSFLKYDKYNTNMYCIKLNIGCPDEFNQITYLTENKSNYQMIKNSLGDDYICYDTFVDGDNLKTIYKNKKYTITFGLTTNRYYAVNIFDNRQYELYIDTRERERDSIDRERERERDSIDRERERERDSINERIYNYKKYKNEISIADSLLKNKDYESAKKSYIFASEIEVGESYPKEQISKIDTIVSFLLNKRKIIQYDYKRLDASCYESNSHEITEIIKNTIREYNSKDSTIICNVIFKIDTIGKISISIFPETMLSRLFLTKMMDIKFNKVLMYDTTIFTKAEYYIKIEDKHFICKKTNRGIIYDTDEYLINSELMRYNTNSKMLSKIKSYPNGKFNIGIKEMQINNTHNCIFDIKYKNDDGPINAIKSILVPGLGVSKVTHGNKSGIRTASIVYGLILSSALLKLMSNSEYDEYKKHKTDNLYYNANTYNKMALICAGLASFIWTYNIVWVVDKGIKNNKSHKHIRKYYGY